MFIEIDMKAAIRCYLEGKTVYEVKESGSVEKLSIDKPLKGSRFIIDNREPAVTIDKNKLMRYADFLELMGDIALIRKPFKKMDFNRGLRVVRNIINENYTTEDIMRELALEKAHYDSCSFTIDVRL